MTDDFMNHLRCIVSQDENAGRDVCPMAQEAIAWAMEEVDPDQRSKIRAHVITCRYCLELVMDIRAAREETKQSAGQSPRPHPSLLHAIARTETAPEKPPLPQWFADFKMWVLSLFSLRLMSAATVIAACLMVVFYQWYSPYGEPPFSVSVLVNSGGLMTRGSGAPPPEYELHKGEIMSTGKYFRIRLVLKKIGYVDVMHLKASGKVYLLFSKKIETSEIWIPPDDPHGFRVDNERGREILYVMVSEHPIDKIEQKLQQLDKIDKKALKQIFPHAAIQEFDFVHE